MGDTTASTDPRGWAAPKPSGVRRFLPILVSLPNYDRHFLRFDLIAGATVWGLLVPESIAYAGLAGLPPQAGLYTLLVTLAAYAVFGTSRHLVAAATSAAAVLLASAISGLSPPDASHYASDAAALVLFCGGLFVVAGLLRLGFVAQFLSRPVMEGFVFGLAIFVTISQLPKLFGIKKGTGDTIAQFVHLLGHLGDTNGATFAIGASTLATVIRSRSPGSAHPGRAAGPGPRDRHQLDPQPVSAWSRDRRARAQRAASPVRSQHQEQRRRGAAGCCRRHAAGHLQRIARRG